MSLRLDWCSHEAAKYACLNWHYSKSIPAGKLVKVGAWESDQFIGAVLFGRGASDAIGRPYNLEQTQVCELVRVAMRQHAAPTSKIVARAIRFLAKTQPGLRLIVSYADPAQNHHGGIYQAMNWVYTGTTAADYAIIDRHGKRWHSRMVSSKGYKTSFGVKRAVIRPEDGTRVTLPGKHRYLYPLDDEMRQRIQPLAKPYPKRASEAGDDPRPAGTAGVQRSPGRSTPKTDTV